MFQKCIERNRFLKIYFTIKPDQMNAYDIRNERISFTNFPRYTCIFAWNTASMSNFLMTQKEKL